MRTKIAYKASPDSFGPSGSYIYTVILNVQIALPLPNAPRTKRFEAIVDSGATRCLFDADVATHLGLDFKSGEIEVTQGIGGNETVYLHPITLHIPGGPVTTKVGFKEKLPVAGLLGMKGFFEFFQISFDPDAKICEIERIYRT
ncbi:MAG TPA: retropepsin-like aspartic protease [Candidatus Angelobacter sp.]|nr:retropepsin-like aspartic protease [Candidatus Angelobacter sp.]